MRVLKLANMGYFAIASLTCHTGLGEPFAHVGSVRGSRLLKTSADSDSSALDHLRLCKVISTQVHSWDRAYEMRSLCINHGQASYRIHHFMLPILVVSHLGSSPLNETLLMIKYYIQLGVSSVDVHISRLGTNVLG